jgi:hypothetical protein
MAKYNSPNDGFAFHRSHVSTELFHFMKNGENLSLFGVLSDPDPDKFIDRQRDTV